MLELIGIKADLTLTRILKPCQFFELHQKAPVLLH